MKERFVAKRVLNIFLMLLVTLILTGALGISRGKWIDEMLGIYAIVTVFFVLFVFLLEHSRAGNRISGNRQTDFTKIMVGYTGSAAVIFAGSYLPEFLKPVIIVPILMSALSTPEISMCTGIFFDVLLGLSAGFSVQELTLCCLMTLLGCIVADAIEDGRYQFWYQMIILLISVLLPGLFYYFSYQEVKMTLFLYGAIQGVILVYLILLFHRRIVNFRNSEVAGLIGRMLDDSYPLARELLQYYKVEYHHGRRVSALAGKCAAAVNADADICAAAGFYYRIGIMEGEPLGESGARIAQKHCFPEEVIQIIYEYNGEQSLPSTMESAIVHMVDGLVKKLEALNRQETMSSEWNQDMVIYQTLNEFSAQGLYDRSGLSMNMFLKIREYLVKEETLI